ncbi:electron transfer flavoprotein subunit beta/FixA family protein [Levilactobacillus bambusae]|uniref:Electron transfer flavoprotein small subunit n=1 Tax=Levilactobacillus bambusae TaxID=2024736 RepID=A0A2V1MZC0_9LACO|nr:electron transfer flavoprotein subunit beta/FixA family protein [Levilactobacillus bambusae]PWG00371.1 electron transfer flavoprotein subunit beta [Levilactobacillus bambusae]
MKIVVCIKQVPSTNDVKIDPQTHNLVRSADGVINPFDKNAIEAALKLRDQTNGEVILLSMGPESYRESLLEGLAMGADSAYLLSSRALGGADTLATGYPLSQAIQKIGDVELVLFGRQSVDADTGQVGPIVAEYLNVPQVTFAEAIDLTEDHHLIGKRRLDAAEQEVEVELPAAVTVRSEMNQPRYATPRQIQKSFEKPLTVWTEQDLDLDPERIGLAGSPTQVTQVYAPAAAKKRVTMLTGTPEHAVQELLQSL